VRKVQEGKVLPATVSGRNRRRGVFICVGGNRRRHFGGAVLFSFSFEVWGDLMAWDQAVLRGSLEGDSFAYYYFDRGKMAGVLAMDRPNEERKPMQQLVRARVLHEDLAATLQDEAVDLGGLIG